MPYLLDTDWLIEALKRREPAFGTLRRLTAGGVAISWVTVAEVYEGPFDSPNPQAQLSAIRHFLSGYRIFGLDDQIAERFAEIRADLRRRGELLADLDLLIAATALAYDLILLTLNRRHFERVPDLKLYRLT
ncbi:MAG: hypothetical protein QOF33_1771 [Thermomicrobiales bacterium]|jgi:tRNA(fMet)-specific endonuclease VapC|nr:hypothetical protein [Thermomicrobiales bacterium]MEA2594906.1 hypothetical protein [Thermomicrobiales bacterium]